jgi:hypothetical protein
MPSYQPAHGTLYLEYVIQHISIPNFTKNTKKSHCLPKSNLQVYLSIPDPSALLTCLVI